MDVEEMKIAENWARRHSLECNALPATGGDYRMT
jgi:hypothetical protein